ncbi:MAG: thiolase domain-containing protein [Euryarchaeota archaeon]|nr:thiolase domain-containing protein [Euryarchaeota archaeon]
MREVAVVGVGSTRFGEQWDKSFRDGFAEAGLKAIADARIKGEDIDSIYIGNMSAGKFIEQEHVGALVADVSGLSGFHIPATRVEGACASGALALRQGYLAIASGQNDLVVVAGVEKTTDVASELVEDMQASAADREWEGFQGATLPALFAMMARAHMHRYGTTREQLAQVAVQNHQNATRNPEAQYRRVIKIEDVMGSPWVADPLRVLDCAGAADGASALILAPLDQAKKYTQTPVVIAASSQTSGTLALHDRPDLTTIDSIQAAAQKAYQKAGVQPKDIQVAELHDSYTIAELLALEDLGFCPKGQSGKFVEEGQTLPDGQIAVNPGGGLKGCGHPLGATGVRQAIEIVHQLRGTAGDRQVPNAQVGLAQSLGGTGGTCVVHILRRP